MDKLLDAQFQRVESSFATLINDITSYNPSTQAAQDLCTATEELDQGLEQLSVHQANYARILELRSLVESLDNKLKDNLQNLASLRKDLIACKITPDAPGTRAVPVKELLSYAKNISRYTVPPHALITPPQEQSQDVQEATSDQAPGSTTQTQLPPAANGLASPPPTNEPTQMTQTTQTQQSTSTEGVRLPKGLENLRSTAMREFLDYSANQPWEPWPSVNQIRSGNLFAIQQMLDRGDDPSQVLTPEQQQEADRRRAQEEEKWKVENEKRAAEEKARRESTFRDGAQNRSGGAPRTATRETFDGGLDLYDPDDE